MIEWEFVAPMLLSIVVVLTVGGVVLLRPLTQRLVELIEVVTREKGTPQLQEDIGRIGDLLETMNSRMRLLEERQDFTDSLLDAQRPASRAELPPVTRSTTAQQD